jgi:squalene synthase HpnC
MTATAPRISETGGLPGEAAILPLAAGENFPVALALVGPRARAHLTAVYGFARLADQLGDEAPGDRLALLDELERELDRAFAGRARHPLLRRLEATIGACGMPREPFLRLIEANRRDQGLVAYRTFDDLLGYCTLSANPVGELVLYVFAMATPDRIELSDKVCTALQLVEHWQDVGEDYRRGRVYLPGEDLARFGVVAEDLGKLATGAPLRELMAFEVARAQTLLDEGAPLVGRLRGRARLAVAGYVGGGRANAGAIVAAGYDVLAGPPRARKAARARTILRTLGGGR